jgi:hypothetical protein
MPAPDIQELLTLHVQTSVRRDVLLEECRRLRDAGQRRAFGRALAAAEDLQRLLTQLERAVRPG